MGAHTHVFSLKSDCFFCSFCITQFNGKFTASILIVIIFCKLFIIVAFVKIIFICFKVSVTVGGMKFDISKKQIIYAIDLVQKIIIIVGNYFRGGIVLAVLDELNYIKSSIFSLFLFKKINFTSGLQIVFLTTEIEIRGDNIVLSFLKIDSKFTDIYI